MELVILSAEMSQTEDGFIGKVQFEVKQHKVPYEIHLYSKRGRDWGYSLSFLNESGIDEEINSLDEYLEQNDNAFDHLVQAAKAAQMN